MKAQLSKLLTAAVLMSFLFTTAASAQPASHITAGGPVSLPAGVDLTNFQVRSDGTVDVMLELYAAPTTIVYASTLTTRHSQMQASLDAQASFSTILNAQTTVKAELAGFSPDVTVLYSVQRAYDGIAVKAKTSDLTKLAALTGVKTVHLMRPKVIDNSFSVPMIGAPAVWQKGLGNRGTGIKVGVIDTGLDYIHTNFGGLGTPAAYAANNTTVVGEVPYYPSIKVAGGYDFAGDAYNASSTNPAFDTPHPDFDPMDCNGHGSHVAGTIGGYGVNADGTTYMGVYGTGTDFAGLRIGPGVAPEATLYGLRVFGCTGSTNLTTEAIDWAVDPNGDGDPSDHLDVINMSLGSPYGSDYSDEAVASDNASMAGMVVVAASGNDSDSHYITSSPATSTRAISVAASTNPQAIMDGFQVIAPPPATIYGSSNAVNGWTSITTVSGDLKYFAANPGACTALPAGTFTGFIALIDWTFLSDNISNQCGSSARVLNAAHAGAIGVLMVYQHPFLDISISGNAAAPSTITTLATGNLIKAAMASGTVTVRLTTDYNGTIKNIDPSVKDMVAGFSSRGPRGVDSFLKPDITAPGQSIFSTLALSGNKGVSEQGTSMATPHMAGVMALLRELHPGWTVEELKALVMNTAAHNLTTLGAGTGDPFATARIGAGRVDVANAADGSVIAYNGDNAGAVSVSFGDVQVPADGKVDIAKNVVVVNKAGSFGHLATYTVAFAADPSLATVGVSFAIEDTAGKPVTSVTLDPGKSTILTVHLIANGSAMKHPLDKTMSKAEVGNPREYMSEAGGYVTLTPTAGADQLLRVPVYAVTEPVSKMNAVPNLVLSGASGEADLALKGVGINTGDTTPVDVKSLVSALELKAINPDLKLTDPTLVPGNFQYVGVMSDRPAADTMANSFIFVGFSTYGKWNSPNLYEFDTYFSTTGDGVPDYVAYTTSLPNGTSSTDVYVVRVVNLNTNTPCADIEFPNWVDGGTMDTAILNNNVMLMPISAACLGLTDTKSKVTFGMLSWSNDTGKMIDHAGVTLDSDGNLTSVNLPFDVKNLALNTTGGSTGAPMYNDMPDTTIPVVFNKANIQGKLMGVLLLHHMNAAGNTAEVVSTHNNQLYLPTIR